MNAFWAQIAGHRLGQDPLRRLGWRKASEAGLAAQCGRIAGGNDGALTGVDHRRGKAPRQVQQPHRVDLKVTVENFRIDLPESTECSANGVVDHDARTAEVALDGGRSGFDLS